MGEILDFILEGILEIFIAATPVKSRKITFWLHGFLRLLTCLAFLALAVLVGVSLLKQNMNLALKIFLVGLCCAFGGLFLWLLYRNTKHSLENYRETY